MTSSAASPPGQSAPAPSAPQKIPKEVSITPTLNFIAFSGTRASGARIATPIAATTSTAATAAAAARPHPVLVRAEGEGDEDHLEALQQNALERDRERVAVEARVRRAPAAVAAAVSSRKISSSSCWAMSPARAEDRLAQPLQPEDEEQASDHQAEGVERQRGQPGPRIAVVTARATTPAPHPRGPSASCGWPDGEDDGQGLHRLDRAGEEDRDREPDLLAAHGDGLICSD